MRVSGCDSDSSIDISGRSGSYCTSISSVARSAVSSSTAATAATASPTIRTLSTQSAGGKQDARSAVPALSGTELGERLLERMQLAPARHALDGLDVPPLALHWKREA